MSSYAWRGPAAHRFRELAQHWWAGDSALLWMIVMLLFTALLFWWGWEWAD